MADDKQQVSDKHYQVMKYFEDLRKDVRFILDDTIHNHYDRVPQTWDGWDEERQKLREDLREIQRRVDRTLNGL